MATVRANWHTDLPVASNRDPFANLDDEIEKVGKPIDLSGNEAGLAEELVDLVEQEARLFDTGVTCGIKDRPDTTCSACPISKAGGKDGGLEALLCRIGVRQEKVLTELAVRKYGK